MWLHHKRHSKWSGKEVQHVFYDKRHRSTVGRAFLIRHTYWSWGSTPRRYISNNNE